MSSETKEGSDPLTTWLVGGSLALAVALAVLAVVLSWPTQAVANALQLLGIALTALGVAVVRSWLQLAADKAIHAKDGLERWSSLRRQQLRAWWARRRGRPPQVIYGEGIASSEAFGSGAVTVGPPAVDRTTISIATGWRTSMTSSTTCASGSETSSSVTPTTSTAALALNATSCVWRSNARPAKAGS